MSTPHSPTSTATPDKIVRSRRSHQKSRTGCLVCKKRKIKCDETRPSCRNCITHNAKCSFLIAAEADGPLADISLGSSSGLNMSDLEYMHHFSVVTVHTLASRPDSLHVWQTFIPRLAITEPMLMHLLLAFSALHISHLQPHKKQFYTLEAIRRHSMAISLFHVKFDGSVKEEDCNALYAFGALLVSYTIACPRVSHFLFLTNVQDNEAEGAVDWFNLLRGTVQMIFLAAWSAVHDGPLKALNQPVREHHEYSETHSTPESIAIDERLKGLRNCWMLEPNSNSVEIDLLEDVLHKLRHVYKLVLCPHPAAEFGNALMSWLLEIPNDFLPLIEQRKPGALVMIAYWAVLWDYERTTWIFEGMSVHLLQTVREWLGDKWLPWINWPLERLGMR